jgi:hypothetical protein
MFIYAVDLFWTICNGTISLILSNLLIRGAIPMARELTSLPVTTKQLLPLTTFRHTKRCGDVVLHREYITAEPQTRAEGRQ